MTFHIQSELRSRLRLPRCGALMTAIIVSLDRKEQWEQKVETTQVSALGPAPCTPRWKGVMGDGRRSGVLFFPLFSVLDFAGSELWIVWNLQGITLGCVDAILSDISSDQLLRKVRVFLLTGLTQLILETQHNSQLPKSVPNVGWEVTYCRQWYCMATPQGKSWPVNVQKLQWPVSSRYDSDFYLFSFFFCYGLYKAQYSCPGMLYCWVVGCCNFTAGKHEFELLTF